MEQKDQENFKDQPILEVDAAGSAAQRDASANGRILVKLRLPKMEDEEEKKEEEVVVAAAAEIPPADQEIKSHYCKECNKIFSSGKALGGHMSSAHIQANKGYYCKKLNSKMKRQNKDSGGSADNTCSLCGKVFRSKKSLFGHMRCHPERDWRGMEPPAKTKADMDLPEDSSETESEDVRLNQEGGEEDDQIDSGFDGGARTVDVASDLKGWPVVAKRGRGFTDPIIRAPVSCSEEKETFVAGHQLIRLLKGESGNHYKRQKTDSGVPKLRIQERDAIDATGRKVENSSEGKEKFECKGKAKADETSDSGSTMSLPDDIDSVDVLFQTAIEVLMNGKRERIDNQKRMQEEKMDSKGDSEKSSTEKYICNKCNRSFPTYQALGGHRASHNKFKLSIVNTADQRANATTVKEKGKSKRKPKSGIATSNVAKAAEKVVLGFDLNMIPSEEDDDDDVYGDAYNHATKS